METGIYHPMGDMLGFPIMTRVRRVFTGLGLQPGLAKLHEGDIILQGLANLSGIYWPPAGNGWFVTILTSVCKRIYHGDLDGLAHSPGGRN
jgi:hypothetical protein